MILQATYFILLLSLAAMLWFTLAKIKKAYAGLTPIMGWLLGLGFFVMAPLFIMVLNGGFTLSALFGSAREWTKIDLTDEKFFWPFIKIWASLMLSFLATHYLVPKRGEQGQGPALERLDRRKIKKAIMTTMGLALSIWALWVWAAGGLVAFLTTHWYSRSQPLLDKFGEATLVFLRFSQANRLIFTAAAVIYTCLVIKEKRGVWFLALVYIFFAGEIMLTGNRIFFALYLLALMAAFWVYGQRKAMIGVLIMVPILAFTFSAWAAVRANMTDPGRAFAAYNEQIDRDGRLATTLMDVTEGANVVLLFNVLNDFGPKYDYLYGASYAKIATVFIPRSVYPQKTLPFSVTIAQVYEPNDRELSFASTALGEMYANFGVLMLVMMPLFSVSLLFLTDYLSRARADLLSIVLFLISAWLARSAFSDNIIILMFSLVLLLLFRFDTAKASDRKPSLRARLSLGID